MPTLTTKTELHEFLQTARETLLWKLEGLSEFDVRRPLTPTGTNLLGLVKHLAGGEFAYFGDTFGRPGGESLPWLGPDAAPNAGMWATPDESRDDIIALYRRAWAHADDTIRALPLHATGQVAWWPAGWNTVTLRHIMIFVLNETQRHVGHADIVRELIDGSAGLRPGNANLPPGDSASWARHHDRVLAAAQAASEAGATRDGHLVVGRSAAKP